MPQPAQATSRAPTPLPPRSSCHRTPLMRKGLREQIRPPRVRIRTPQGRIWAQLARTGIAAMKEMTTTKVRTRGGKERRGGGRWSPAATTLAAAPTSGSHSGGGKGRGRRCEDRRRRARGAAQVAPRAEQPKWYFFHMRTALCLFSACLVIWRNSVNLKLAKFW